jgi:3-methyladenine DNA glycosylase/8-oxoguanine DNA glycosylase
MLETAVRPAGPYSLALSARLAGNATRTFRDGVLRSTLAVDGRAETAQGLERLRFVLALDDDHTPFLRRFAQDPLLGRAVRELRAYRPVRLASVAQSLLRALCGQLIDSKSAWLLERRIVRATTPVLDGLHAPPSCADLARLSPAELRRLGLHARRAAALVRICRSLDLERLRELPTDAAAARLERERGLGPWSVGLVCLEGLGRTERGLVGDLGLIKLCSALQGRWADAADTARLLEPYGEWAGLAGAYLLHGFGRGLVPVPTLAA